MAKYWQFRLSIKCYDIIQRWSWFLSWLANNLKFNSITAGSWLLSTLLTAILKTQICYNSFHTCIQHCFMICSQKDHPTKKSPVTLLTIWDGKFKATAHGKGESYSGRPSTPSDQRLKIAAIFKLRRKYSKFWFYGYI